MSWGFEELGRLVEVGGVLLLRGVLVVPGHGPLEVALRNPEVAFHLLDRLPAVDERDQIVLLLVHVRLVDDEVGRRIRLFQNETRGACVVGVLGDEALAELVDDDAHDHAGRSRSGGR